MKQDVLVYLTDDKELFRFNITRKNVKRYVRQGVNWNEAPSRNLRYVWPPINKLKMKGFRELKGKQLTMLLMQLE